MVQGPCYGMVLNVPPSYCHATPSYCRVIGEVGQMEVFHSRLQLFCGMHRKRFPIQNHWLRLAWIMTCTRCWSLWWKFCFCQSVLWDFFICLYLHLVVYNWRYIWRRNFLSNWFCVWIFEVLMIIAVRGEGLRETTVRILWLGLWCDQLFRNWTWWVCRWARVYLNPLRIKAWFYVAL